MTIKTLIKLFLTLVLVFVGMQSISTGALGMSYPNTFVMFGGMVLGILGPIACLLGLWYLWDVNSLLDKLKEETNEKVDSK